MLRPYQSAFAALITLPLIAFSANAQSSVLETQFDERGVSRLVYKGVVLVDLTAKRGDPFSVGAYSLGGQEAWGGSDYKPEWDGTRRLLTWKYAWGSVACEFRQLPPSQLRLAITVTNTSAQTLDAFTIFPLGLEFPSLPKGFGAPNYPQFRNGLDALPALIADFGSGAMALSHGEPDALYVGLRPSGPANHYQVQAGSLNDSAIGFLARAVPVNRPVTAGKVDRFTIDLRWADAGATVATLIPDLIRKYAAAWPQKLRWPDRRPIGELFLTDPAPKARDEKLPNPRNYIFAKSTDVHTEEGKKRFRDAALAFADGAVARLKAQGAQGVLVWDLEGQQYPQPDPSYIGDPGQLTKLAPEMDAVADEFFRRITQAGLKCGVTIRPQRLTYSGVSPKQTEVPASDTAKTMVEKMSYARKRWGCTMFYVDSNGGPNDATAPSVFADVLRQLPDVLIIPENIWPKDYAYTAPLASFTAPYKPLHTPPEITAIWPRAFTVTYVGDAPGRSLKTKPDLWRAVQAATARGDVLSFRAWYDDQPLNREVFELNTKSSR